MTATNSVNGVFSCTKKDDEELKGLPNARNIISLEFANCMLPWTYIISLVVTFWDFFFSLVLLISTDLSVC